VESYKNSETPLAIMQGFPPDAAWRVPRNRWDRPPWNRWSFQHVREILPTQTVWRGAGPSAGLAQAETDIASVDFIDHRGQKTTIERFLDDTYSDGFLVMHRGKIIHESYHNGLQPSTPHLLQSVSKSITATVASILIGRGQLDPKAPITDYLPELATTAWNGASLQHILDMTSGVRYDETYTWTDSDMGKTDVASGWKTAPEEAGSDADWPNCIWDQILSLKVREAEHGTRFSYRSIETDVLAHAMMRTTGRDLPTLVSTELWQPMGAEEDGYFTVDAAGYALADGGFNACLRDLGRFGQLYLNAGQGNGRQIIPTDWIADVRRGAHGHFNEDRRKLFPNGHYRNQFWIEDTTTEAFMAVGVFGQLVYIAPAYEMVVVKLSSWPDFLNDAFKADTHLALHAIARALGHSG